MSVIDQNKQSGTYNPEIFRQCAVGTCMTQMSARQGIKTYGNQTIEAMTKEYSQLEDLKVFSPVHKRNLSTEARKNALQGI